MDKFTKEQSSLYTVIAAIVMLLAFFLFKLGGSTPWEMLTKGYGIGWLGYIFLVLFLLTPIYLCIYAYRDTKVLEPLKPITNFSPSVVYAFPICLWCVFILYFFIDSGMASVWVFLLAALAAYFIGKKSE